MAFLFNFNMPKAKQFSYRPWFYDERKERLEKMKARAEAEIAAEKNNSGNTGLERGFLINSRANSKFHRKSLERGSVLRFIIILIALLGITYYLVPELFIAFWKIK